MEEVLSQPGMSPKMPFRFTQLSRLPCICSLLLKHQQTCLITPHDQLHYCIHVRVTLGERRGNQPPTSHVWNGSLIADILQEVCPRDWITKAVVLAPGKAVLFFGRCLHREGLLYRNVQDIELGLSGPVSWTGRMMQVEATVNPMQEGCWAIADAVIEKKMKAKRSGCPQGLRRPTKSSTATCNIDDWMWGLDEGASDGEVRRTGDVCIHRYEWGGCHA